MHRGSRHHTNPSHPPGILTVMSFVAWLVKQVFSYMDWVPSRHRKRWLVLFVALSTVLAPSAFGAGMLGLRPRREHRYWLRDDGVWSTPSFVGRSETEVRIASR